MSGTVGSLGGLLVYFLVKDNMALYGGVLIVLFALGMLFAGEAERICGKKDASIIVIDEVCGMLLSLFFVPFSAYVVVLGFFIFRLFDIVKPFPAKRMERMRGSAGIMLDDVVAGLYTNLLLQVVFRLLSK